MLLHRKLSLICPAIISNFLIFAACSQPIQRLSYRGIPQDAVPKSFKIQMKEDGLDSKQNLERLQTTSQRVAASVGCDLDQVAPIAWEQDVMSSSLASIYHVTLKGCELPRSKLEETLTAFSEDDSIVAVEAEARIKTSLSENDPGKKQQEYLSVISRDSACDAVQAGAQEIVVAVIDSGVQSNHPDLMASFKTDADGQVVGANFVGKGSSGRPDASWNDQNGHGTHVAGIIAAAANNKIGVSGVAACANVKIMPIRVMDANGAGSSIEIDRGIQWAIAHGAHIINLSLGSNVGFRSPQSSHPNALFDEAAARGVVVFAAAGNESLTLGQSRQGYIYSYPASYDHVISVAALENDGSLAEFSNRGETVDIAAPGVNILSTYMGSGYRRESGTSMASPVAAGAFALALSVSHPKDKVSSATVDAALLKAVTNRSLNAADVTSGGTIDAQSLASLLGAQKAPTPIVPDAPKEDEGTIGMPNGSGEEEPAPVVAPAPVEDTMVFKDLAAGMQWGKARAITVQNWPKGSTAEIHLYWLTASNPRPFSFVTLDRSNLTVDGLAVTSDRSYLLYGQGILVAEAVDADGKTVGTSQIAIEGL